MKNIGTFLLTLVVGTMLAAGTAFAAAGTDAGTGHCRDGKHGKGERFAAALGLSSEQKEAIRAVREKYRPALQPLRKDAVAERRVQRELILAEPQDEAAIRAQASKIATTAGDIAVQRARMFREIRALLSPEQLQKLAELRAQRDGKVDRFLDRGKRQGKENEEGTR